MKFEVWHLDQEFYNVNKNHTWISGPPLTKPNTVYNNAFLYNIEEKKKYSRLLGII